MWFSILFYILISFLTIYIVHQLWGYIKEKYSVKKYLVGSQITKYKSILRELQEHSPTSSESDLDTLLQSFDADSSHSAHIDAELKSDLEDFMKEIQN